MRKIIFLVILLPLTVFANESQKRCDNEIDPAKKKDCLVIEKRAEAQDRFKNFQKNIHMPDKEDF